MKKFFKWALIGVCVLCIFFGIGGYLVYRNRAAIASKAMNYAMQSLTGSPEDGTQTWLGALIEGDSSQDVKEALIKSVMKRGSKMLADRKDNGDKTETASKRKPGLATMADMLVNGAGGEGVDLGQMAQALLGGLTEENAAQKQCGNDINARDTKGRTLLMNVCRVDVTPKVIKMLLRFGADINAVDNNGRNALMYAVALNEDPEVVEMLLESGADANHTDDQGKTVLEYAKIDEIRDIVRKYVKHKGWFF